MEHSLVRLTTATYHTLWMRAFLSLYPLSLARKRNASRHRSKNKQLPSGARVVNHLVLARYCGLPHNNHHQDQRCFTDTPHRPARSHCLGAVVRSSSALMERDSHCGLVQRLADETSISKI